MDELTRLSAKQLVTLIKNKKISCVELMQAHLDRIKKVNPLINALVQMLSPEEALKQAKLKDEAIASGKPIGQLHGIPIAVKDGRKVKGFLTTVGCKSPHNKIATEDATIVSRLREAGGIILGVTNIPAFLVSAETDNLLYGRTNNPYDLKRVPGGSSGGQGALIAAQGVPLGIGSDSGGSLRQPANACGIVTLKPTQNLIPMTGLFPSDETGMIGSIDVQGPMARYVEDLIFTLPILAGPDGRDPNVVPISLQDPTTVNLKKLRIAFHTDVGRAVASEDVANTIRAVAKALSKEVFSVHEDCPKILAESYQSLLELYFYGGDHGKWLTDFIDFMDAKEPEPMVQDLINRAKQCELSANEIRNRFVYADQFKWKMMEFMKDYDVIICPVSTMPAREHRKVDTFKEVMYTFPYNVAGWPAAVIRCGTSKEGLPIGVQVIAKSWQENIVLAVAQRLEEIFGGWQPSNL
ncbi:hypothetical protein AYO45_05175 [Gammaproteobacteria bacterium SCGC AG-212-F23]|nr:hypothetical protein AYO45_05175 [Gammaproteobacteria bacterium SCGC AG-212-F23]